MSDKDQNSYSSDGRGAADSSAGAWWAGADGQATSGPQQPYAFGDQTGPSTSPYGPAYGAGYGSTPPYNAPAGYPGGSYAGSEASDPYATTTLAPQAPVPPRTGTPWFRRGAAAAILAVVALASGTAGAAIANEFDGNGSAPVASAAGTAAATQTSTTTAVPATQSLAKVAAKVTPSVVSVSFTSSSGAGEGSGVILTSDGQILTNNHVVAAAANGGSITVKFSNGKSASAKILGRDPSTDLAVIQAQGVSGLTPATLGSSSSLHVGDTVLAIGNPLGLEGSVSAGIVSALHRSVDIPAEEDQQSPQQMFGNPFGGLGGNGSNGNGNGNGSGSTSSSSGGTVLKNAIQTDAAVNPGNSGGALVDINGDVVGINSAIASLSSSSSGESGSIGVGFAIPIDTAKVIAQQLAKGETVKHPILGITIGDPTDGSAGAQIGTVESGSGAAKAGLKKGDIVTAVNGTAITDADALQAAIANYRPGDVVTLTYARNGSQHTAKVTLGAS